MNAVSLTTRLIALPARLAAAGSLAALALLSAPSVQAHDSQDSGVCRPVVKNARTDFPTVAQRAGAHGAVIVSIHIDAIGKASDVSVIESSGHRELDKAAIESVRNHWEFDVANCTAADLQREQTASVEFVRAKPTTLYATRDVQAIAKAKELRANQQCYTAEVDPNQTVFSCYQTAEQLAAKSRTPSPQLQATR